MLGSKGTVSLMMSIFLFGKNRARSGCDVGRMWEGIAESEEDRCLGRSAKI